MPGQRVEILYEVITRGQEKIAQLGRQTAELEAQNKKLTAATVRQTEAQTKAENATVGFRKSLSQLRSVMLPITLALVAMGGAYAILSRNSNDLQSVNEKVGRSFSRLAATIGDRLAVGLNDAANAVVFLLDKMNELAKVRLPSAWEDFMKGGISGAAAGFFDKNRAQKRADEAKAKSDALASERIMKMREDFAIGIARAEGDTEKALRLQIAQKRRLIELDETLGSKKQEMLKLFNQQAAAEMETLKMAELGLKKYQQIGKDFRRDMVSAFRSGVSDPIYDLLQGKKMNLQDLIEPLRSGINRAISTAIGDMFVTKAFSKGSPFSGIGKMFGFGKDKTDPAAQAVEKANEDAKKKADEIKEEIRRLQECCRSNTQNTAMTAAGMSVVANNIGRMGGFSGISGITATLTGGKGGGILSKIGGIASAVGGLGGLGGLSGMFGGGASALPAGAGFSGGGFGSLPGESMHSGGWVGAKRYASGGEVPAFVQPGEFVVRRGAAAENKDVLEGMHRGEKVKGAQNVFMIKANDANSFSQMLANPASRAQLEIQIIKAIAGNGTVRQVIKDFAR